MPQRPLQHKPRGESASAEGRPSARQRGYDSRWERRAKAFLAQNPLCVECEKAGIVAEATEVDHVRPHRGNRQLFEDESNLQSLCKPCHSRKTARGE